MKNYKKGDIISSKNWNFLIDKGYKLECYALENWRTLYKIKSITKTKGEKK